MNEYQRQAYLSALGVDNYMPRWRLPLAPEPVACVLPVRAAFPPSEVAQKEAAQSSEAVRAPRSSPASIDQVLRDIAGEQKAVRSTNLPPMHAGIAAAIDNSAVSLPPFSLSIWRPAHPILIVAERHPRSALPVEPLIANVVRGAFASDIASGSEEVLRWPLVESASAPRLAADARIALQTWLEAELTCRPVPFLWLMGSAAIRHFLPDSIADDADCMWQLVELEAWQIRALVTPDPVALLHQPQMKRQLWIALQSLSTA